MNSIKIRILILSLLVVLLFALLGVKLWIEQVKSFSVHQERVLRQSIRRIRIPALRGRILSSDLQILADNEAAYEACFYLEEMRKSTRRNTIIHIRNVMQEIARATGRSMSDFLTDKQIATHINMRPGLPLTVCSQLNEFEIAKVLEVANRYDGVSVLPKVQRRYPYGDLASGLIGYVRLADPRSATDKEDFFYYVPDLVGRSGIEKAFDQLGENTGVRGLRGRAGFSTVQVDNMGFVHQVLSDDIIPENGNNVVLTIDSRAQKISQELLRNSCGAIVVLDADSGAVLAMASSPWFDLNDFTPTLSPQKYRDLLNDPKRPLTNRAIQGSYTPGSILKPLTALAILDNNVSPQTVIECDGFSYIGKTKVRCSAWRRGGHGLVNLYDALEQSCNEYFIELGCATGLDNIKRVLDSARIGEYSGFELGGSKGLSPSREYKKKNYKSSWNAFDTGLLSIGQGIILITPLQGAVYTAALANGGKIMRPYLVDRITDFDGKTLYQTQPEVLSELYADTEAIEAVRRGMHQVVNAPHGSGRAAKTSAIELYGKTGSAQVGTSVISTDSWFICFGEKEGKRYAMLILVEDSVSGGGSAAPLARRFFEEYLGFSN